MLEFFDRFLKGRANRFEFVDLILELALLVG
jgi:hypothetical protein